MKLSDILKEAKAPQEQIDAALEMESNLTKVNDEAATRRRKAGELKDQLAKFDGIDPEEAKGLMEKIATAEQDKLKSEGKYEEALAKGLKELSGDVETLKGLLKDKDGKLSTVLIDNTILSAIDGKAINPDQVMSLLRGNIKLEENAPVVMEGEAHKLNKAGERMSVAGYAQEFLANNPHHVNPN